LLHQFATSIYQRPLITIRF